LALLIEDCQNPILSAGNKGLAMRTITIRVRAVDFAERMTAMRIWLDQHQFEPSTFKYSEDGNDLLIDVSFREAVEAAAFSARFNGGDILGTLTAPTLAAKRDIPIGEAGDLYRDDLKS
jgi:hypothetical protein